MTARRPLRAFVPALLLVLAGCPDDPDAAPRPSGVVRTATGTETPAAGARSAGGTGASAAAADGAAAPRATDGARPVVYEKLRGGVHVARCPSCGEVQAENAEKCPGCGQTLSSWRLETLCTRCEGDGRCDRCGDERVCLACDGDGVCAYCEGKGTAAGSAAKCAECGGSGRCPSCRGDGRRESVTGDFLPNEGWLPGACPTCIDGSGLCPECGSAGKDRTGAPCLTCGGLGACPDCAGTGECSGCAADGACTVCGGTGREVRNGALRGPDQRVRLIRTTAGSLLTGRVDVAPSAQGLRVVVGDGAKSAPTQLPKSQVAPLSWWLVQRDFGPGWDGVASPEPAEISKHLGDLADLAVDGKWWPLAMHALSTSIAVDPGHAIATRNRLQEVDAKRVEDWLARAESAARSADRERAAQLLEMVVFKGRGSAVATRAELQLLQLRKDREIEANKLEPAERDRRAADAKAAADRATARARLRIDRARRLLDRAARAGDGDATADRTFARAEWAAASARRILDAEAARDPPAAVAWTAPPEALVTESRLVTASVLGAWATRAVAGGRFDLGARIARRGLQTDASDATLKRLLEEAQGGLARSGVVQGSAPPRPR